ncbi:MAG: hypothetical protein B1H13_11745 [Desulfobacteraceae bacterium 4484_190.3]|nr:MAG: hypothetical protein B1H13_11745 [Desulfobacteraceae bacterium 4484_190.3]
MKKLAAKLYKIVLIFLVFAAGVALEKTGTIAFLIDPYNYPELMRLLFQHFYLVAISMAIATIAGLIIGIALTRPKLKKYSGIVMYIVGLGQTIPSLAVLALVMSFLGIGTKPALTGFRVALVMNIGTVALAYLIGAGGMGDWIFSGIDMMMTDKLLAGAIPVTMMALLADFLVELLSAVLVSKGLRLTEE